MLTWSHVPIYMFAKNIAHAMEVMEELENTYFFASEHSILGRSKYETLNMEDAVPTQKGGYRETDMS